MKNKHKNNIFKKKEKREHLIKKYIYVLKITDRELPTLMW